MRLLYYSFNTAHLNWSEKLFFKFEFVSLHVYESNKADAGTGAGEEPEWSRSGAGVEPEWSRSGAEIRGKKWRLAEIK